MEHITITDLDNGYHRLVPDKGYALVNVNQPTLHFSVARVKDISGWYAVEE